VVKTCSTTESPGMIAARGGRKVTRRGAAGRPLSRCCFSTLFGLDTNGKGIASIRKCGVGKLVTMKRAEQGAGRLLHLVKAYITIM